eukprot:jgi/Mesvir1/28910/Mv17997-RA.1
MSAMDWESTRAAIDAALKGCPLLDHHCHCLVSDDSDKRFEEFMSEAEGPSLNDAVNTVAFKRSIREVAALLGCSHDLPSVVAKRAELGASKLATLMFRSSNISAMLVDDGLRFVDDLLPLAAHARVVPIVKRVLRIETLAEEIIEARGKDAPRLSLNDFETLLKNSLSRLPANVVALKTVVAYRTGLLIRMDWPREDVAQALLLTAQDSVTKGRARINLKPLTDFVFLLGAEAAVTHSIPLQMHTGFGDTDLDLPLSNPCLLKNILVHKPFASLKLVLLHASYPYMREAGYLCSVYPQIYVDFGLAIPLLTVSGMRHCMRQVLELAPTNKLLMSTDGHFFPEIFFIGAKWSRQVLVDVLLENVVNRDLMPDEAIAVGKAMLNNNAATLYGLPELIVP